MNKENQLGVNIRSLRKAHGETGEQLGVVLNYEKNMISYYEKGKRKPSVETVSEIAKHYMVTIEDLLHSDLSSISKININIDAVYKNMDIIVPIVSSEKAMQNPHFQKAYSAQRELYDEFKRVSLDKIDNIDICLDEYPESLNDGTGVEAAANLIGILYLLMLGINASACGVRDQPAVVQLISRKDEKMRKIIETSNPSLETKAQEMMADFHDEESTETLSELLITIKKAKEWADLGDYYLALRYVWNLVGNGLDWGFNLRIGLEMLYAFASVGNAYAARYLQFQIEMMNRESSQIVNDKE